MGSSALGTYFFAYNAGLGIVTSLVNSFGTVSFPMLCAATGHQRQRILRKIVLAGLAIFTPLIAAQSLLAPFEDAPSNLIVSGRYILQPDVMRILDGQDKGAGGEIQLTDAMAQLIGHQPFHAVTFAGRRFDCGSKAGFVEATLALALARPDLADEVAKAAWRLLSEAKQAQAA